jgi:hypothetical protein
MLPENSWNHANAAVNHLMTTESHALDLPDPEN